MPLCLGFALPPAHGESIKVLWYTYAHPSSQYRQTIQKLADVVHALPLASGLAWKLTFFGPDAPPPVFGDYNVLVIHSAEWGFTGRQVTGDAGVATPQPNIPPDYSGILRNKARIEAARGERTFITGSDADWHTIQGDTGNAPPAGADARGHWFVIRPSRVRPAGTGRSGISSTPSTGPAAVAGWESSRSWPPNTPGRCGGFTRTPSCAPSCRAVSPSFGKQTSGARTIRSSAPRPKKYPLNYGLTTKGLSNWKYSFHAGISRSIPGYAAIVDSTRYPHLAVAIATAKFASASANGPPE